MSIGFPALTKCLKGAWQDVPMQQETRFFEKRRSGSIRDILSRVEADRAVDLIVTRDAWLFD